MMTDAQVAAQVCVASVVPGTPSTAICSGLSVHRGPAHPLAWHQITRDDLRRIGPGSGRTCGRSTQPSPALGDALNAGYRYLEVKCLGCDTHQTVALYIVTTTRRQLPPMLFQPSAVIHLLNRLSPSVEYRQRAL